MKDIQWQQKVCTAAHTVGNAGTVFDSFLLENSGMETIVVPTIMNACLKCFTEC